MNLTGKGGWKKGQSGNPAGGPGRPRMPESFKQALARMEPKALDAVEKALDSPSTRMKLLAAQMVFDRRYGKPMQPTENINVDVSRLLARLSEGEREELHPPFGAVMRPRWRGPITWVQY